MIEDKNNSLPLYLFHQGTNYASYEFLGVHAVPGDAPYQYTFRVWAPNADEVRVIGDFCAWTDGWPMTRLPDSGGGRLPSSAPPLWRERTTNMLSVGDGVPL